MRFVPIDPQALTAEQRPLYERMLKGVQRKYHDFVTQRSDGALIGPWNAWLHDPELGTALWEATEALTVHQRIPDRVRQVVILAVGGRFKAAYELYSHSAVAAKKYGASPRRLATLASGQRPDDLDNEEALAFDTTHALLAGGVLPQTIYSRCLEVFGQLGTNELIYLVGHYCVVSLTLNGFAVPSPDLDDAV